ncbi:MAG TPA: Gx transporter family protein [Clostridiaceae bacterium]|nr:Gx transporter family protein [Clostridiaceae bacterium]
MLSQALVLSVVESWIPVPVPVPGVKLGLANIITMVIIAFMGTADTFILVVLRCLLTSMFGGGISVFLFSIAGGLLSAVVMLVLHKKFSRVFSVVGISIAGAISHNIGQIMVASVIMKEISVLGYLPVLLISGIITGCFVGFCSSFLIEALKKTNIF